MSGGAHGSPPLLERERDLADLRALLDPAVEASGRLAVVEGPAGIGKTRLLAAFRGEAADREFSVLSARGSELEHEFPFGIVRQLFEPALAIAGAGEHEALFSDAARLAEHVFGVEHDPSEPLTDPGYGVLHGLFWLTSNLAERAPILMTVDDVQWADVASLRYLSFIANRIEDVPIVLVVAMRPDGPIRADGDIRARESLRLHPGVAPIDLAPLSLKGVGVVLDSQLGGSVDPEIRETAHAATAGNPFLLEELCREMAGHTRAGRDLDAAAIAELGPARIAASIVSRLERLSLGADSLARSVAVLGDRAEADDAAKLGDIDEADVRSLADQLAGEGVFGPGPPLNFRHPIVRTSIYEAIPPHERQLLHASAAAILDARGAPSESIAVHAMLSPARGDEATVHRLRAAAAAAIRAGAPRSALELLARALEEPPPENLRAEILHEAGTAARLDGDIAVVNWLKEALHLTDDPRRRGAIAAELGEVMSTLGRDEEAVGLLASAASDAQSAGLDDLVIRIRGVMLVLANATVGTRRLLVDELRQTIADLERDPAPHPVMASHGAVEHAVAIGPATRAIELGRLALEGGIIGMATADAPPPYLAAAGLWLSGRYEEAERWLSATLDEARGRGAAIGFVLASALRAMTRWRAGDLTGARADAEAVLEVGLAGGWTPVGVPVAVAVLVWSSIARGEPKAGEQLADLAQSSDIPDDLALTQHLRLAGADLDVALGRFREAAKTVERIALWERDWGSQTGAWCPWRKTAALAHHGLGEDDRARLLAEQEVEKARAFGAPPYLGAALRVAGQVGASGEPLGMLAESVEVLRGSEARLEFARSLLAWGAARRRSGADRDARELLREANGLARACGATGIEQEALDELVAAGARPRVRTAGDADALTPAEARVARLAAEGRTNREIAQALYVTLKTVETHLSRVYRKLEISSRAQLPARLRRSEAAP